MVGPAGFEPAAPCSQSRCATKLRYGPTPDIRPDGPENGIAQYRVGDWARQTWIPGACDRLSL